MKDSFSISLDSKLYGVDFLLVNKVWYRYYFLMLSSLALWLERLAALQRSVMRRLAAQEGLQLVHLEIIQYLSVCNRYSDSAQAVSDYLGQTKGSISQSLNLLVTDNFVKRTQDRKDKRIFHLSLTPKGLSIARRLQEAIDLEGHKDNEESLKSLVATLQAKNGFQGFGTCRTCKYNENPGKNAFTCGLTKEKLSLEDTAKLCREHRFA